LKALQLLFNNFDLLLDQPDGVQQMKQTILQWAIQGKLVRQDPNDEPASELLKRIALEKAELIAQKKIKKQQKIEEEKQKKKEESRKMKEVLEKKEIEEEKQKKKEEDAKKLR